MRFFEKINSLQNVFRDDECREESHAFFYGVEKDPPPIANHIIFSPMSDELIKLLIASYKLTIPEELLSLYRTMNGALLFWSVRQSYNLRRKIPFCCFSIYGVPTDNSNNLIQPFNVSIEDLDRPIGTPESWLKFGNYRSREVNSERYDLFVDTYGLKVYAIKADITACNIVQMWSSIDECLCYIFDTLTNG